MVKLTVILSVSRRDFYRRDFIDSLRIYARGGGGGMGYPKYGGMGGNGGDVYVQASKTEGLTLKRFLKEFPTKRFIAGNGGNSRMYRILGERGKDLTVPCPTGVIVYSEIGRKLGELDKPGDTVRISRGGAGGRLENQFNGQRGEIQNITLDLKLIADVGLVGYPNAGKSSLLKAISRATPKIANYPFTTICPQLGILGYDDHRQISMADLPGLIEGAHENVGLGHRFLKHLERTKILLFVIDINGFRLNPHAHYRTPFETLVLLNKELELFREELLEKPSILVINKMDTENAENRSTDLLTDIKNIADVTNGWSTEARPKRFIHFDDILLISSMIGTNVPELKQRIRELIDFHAEEKKVLNPEIKSVNLLVKKKPNIVAL